MVDQAAEKRTGLPSVTKAAVSEPKQQETWIWIGHQLDEDRPRVAPPPEEAATPAKGGLITSGVTAAWRAQQLCSREC